LKPSAGSALCGARGAFRKGPQKGPSTRNIVVERRGAGGRLARERLGGGFRFYDHFIGQQQKQVCFAEAAALGCSPRCFQFVEGVSQLAAELLEVAHGPISRSVLAEAAGAQWQRQ